MLAIAHAPYMSGDQIPRLGDLHRRLTKRWTIEPQFRDTKDLRFGMALSSTRIGEPMRRDRLLLVRAFATALLTLLGSVG
jgi:hypothetical protein